MRTARALESVLLKKVFDHALSECVDEVYVTVFEKHAPLLALLQRYGFAQFGSKTTPNGTELVLVKRMRDEGSGVLDRYPLIKVGSNRAYLLSLYPQWHTRLLPDSILRNESASIVQDVSHTNSIHKVYLASMRGMEVLTPGDVLLIYRTSDGSGPAHYRSVVTSVCVLEEYRDIRSFSSREDFLRYCQSYSVFTPAELEDFWKRKKYYHALRFSYNFALPRRVTRGYMIEQLGFPGAGAYWGFMPISVDQLRAVVAAGNLDANYVVD